MRGRDFVPTDIDGLKIEKNQHGYLWATVRGRHSQRMMIHRLIMENHLGRYLDTSEIVHHRDGDKLNNDLGNLQLLDSAREHERIHRTEPPVRNCVVCGREFTVAHRIRTSTRDYSTRYSRQRCCSKECGAEARRNGQRKKETQQIITKDELEALVWQMPTEHIAKRLGISGSAIAKRCKKLGIKKPGRGYWAKQKRERESEK